MEPGPRLLLIDTPEAFLEPSLLWGGAPGEVYRVASEADLVRALEAGWDLVLIGSPVSFRSTLTVLDLVLARWPDQVVGIVSDALEAAEALEFIRQGAADVVLRAPSRPWHSDLEGLWALAADRRRRAEEVARDQILGRMHRLLSEAHQAIVRSTDTGILLQTVCRLGAQWGPFDRVRAVHTGEQILTTAAEAGEGDAPALFWEKYVLTTGRPAVSPDLAPGGEGGFSGWTSGAVFPLRVGEELWGTLGFYSRTPRTLLPEESVLLEDLADAVGFGLAQKLQEGRRRETERFLSDLANLVPGVFYKLRYRADDGPQFLYVSPGIDLLLPLSPQQAIADSRRVFQALHPADRLHFHRASLRSRDFLTVFSLEFRLRRPNGVVVWVLATAFPQKQDDVVVWTGLAIDVTPQKRLQEALVREQELVAVILDNIVDGVVAVDENDELALVNPTAARLLEGSPETRGPWTGLDPHLPWHARERFQPWFRRRNDGSVLHLEAHVSDLASPGRESRGKVMLLRDMTDRDRIEDRLRQSEKLEAIGLLAGGIAHDFNNLMTGVFGFIQLARMNAREPDRVIHYLDHVQGPFERARTLTQRLLTFARGGEPARSPVNLAPLVPSILQSVLGGTEVTWELVADEPWPVLANTTQLHQVLENLLLNAKQAMPSGGNVRVALANVPAPGPEGRGLTKGPYVAISVQDDGPGIAEDDQSRVFDPFFTTKVSGSGLGLSIAFSIVKKHGGALELESSPGQGALFRAFWPAVTPEAGEA